MLDRGRSGDAACRIDDERARAAGADVDPDKVHGRILLFPATLLFRRAMATPPETSDPACGRRAQPPARAGDDRARRRLRPGPHRPRRAAGPATACPPNASWPCRLASAGRRCAPACRRSPRWGSCRRGMAPARSSRTARRCSRPGRSASWPRSTGSRARRCSRRGACSKSGRSASPRRRPTGEDLANIAEEMAGMFAALDDAADVPRPRHQVPSRDRPRLAQSHPGVPHRDGLRDVLRAAEAQRRAPPAICATRPRCTASSTMRCVTAMPARHRLAMSEHLRQSLSLNTEDLPADAEGAAQP